MTEPPPRKRFQIHLSTAILMSFVAGGLMWINTAVNFGVERHSELQRFGWPFTTYTVDLIYKREKMYPYIYWEVTGVALNLVVGISILFATWFANEWRIRRRAPRKAA